MSPSSAGRSMAGRPTDPSTAEGRRTIWERLAIAAERRSPPENEDLLIQAAKAISAAQDEIAALHRAQPPDESLRKAIVVLGDIRAAQLDVLAAAEYVIHIPRGGGAYIWKHRHGMGGWELRTYGDMGS